MSDPSNRPGDLRPTLAEEAEAALAAARERDGDGATLQVPGSDRPSPDVTDIGRGLVVTAATDVATGIVGVVLLVAALLVAIPIFILTSLVVVILAAVFHPEGTLSAVLGLAWFIGSLVLIGIVYMRILRRLSRRSRTESRGEDQDP